MSDDGGDEPDIAEFTSDIENLNKEKHIVPKNKGNLHLDVLNLNLAI